MEIFSNKCVKLKIRRETIFLNYLFFTLYTYSNILNMKKIVLPLILLALLSCKHVDPVKKRFFDWAAKGQVIGNIPCKGEPGIGYSLYLPSNYTLDKSWPVLYCFDSHGDGRLPVNLLKDIAEKLGYIVVGSNNAKNGLSPEVTNFIISHLFGDTQEAMVINPQRIYTVGFSGGARVACAAALTYPSVTGVIACSAGFEPQPNQRTFQLVGIAGNQDMNYLEMRKLENGLTDWPTLHQLIIFSGKHQWPPRETLADALEMLHFYAMKRGVIPADKELLNAFKAKSVTYARKMAGYGVADSAALGYQYLEQSEKALADLIDNARIVSLKDTLNAKYNLKTWLSMEENIEKAEMERQNVYLNGYTKNSSAWWASEIARLNQKQQTSIQDQSNQRLLAFISLMSFSYVNAAVRNGDWNSASNYLTIYGLADPKNPDYYYFLACLYNNTNKKAEALAALKKAFEFGFTDKLKAKSDPLLRSLQNEEEFKDLIK